MCSLDGNLVKKILLKRDRVVYANCTMTWVIAYSVDWVVLAETAATRYVVIEPISSYACHRTMTSGREHRTRRHTLLVTGLAPTSRPYTRIRLGVLLRQIPQ